MGGVKYLGHDAALKMFQKGSVRLSYCLAFCLLTCLCARGLH